MLHARKFINPGHDVQDLHTKLATANSKMVKLQQELSKSADTAKQQFPALAVGHHRKPALATASSSYGRDAPLPDEATYQVCTCIKAVWMHFRCAGSDLLRSMMQHWSFRRQDCACCGAVLVV